MSYDTEPKRLAVRDVVKFRTGKLQFSVEAISADGRRADLLVWPRTSRSQIRRLVDTSRLVRLGR